MGELPSINPEDDIDKNQLSEKDSSPEKTESGNVLSPDDSLTVEAEQEKLYEYSDFPRGEERYKRLLQQLELPDESNKRYIKELALNLNYLIEYDIARVEPGYTPNSFNIVVSNAESHPQFCQAILNELRVCFNALRVQRNYDIPKEKEVGSLIEKIERIQAEAEFDSWLEEDKT